MAGRPLGDDVWDGFEYPPRAWQAEALPIAWDALLAKRRGIVHACTGAGKTQLTTALSRRVRRTLHPGWRVVLSVPRRKLVVQTVRDMRKLMGRIEVGAWYDKRKEDCPIIVACHASMESLADHFAMEGHRTAFWLADEVHRAQCPEVLEPIARMAPVTRLGVTATPFLSADERVLEGWDTLLYTYPIDRAISDGVLVPFRLVSWDGTGSQQGEDDPDVNWVTMELIRDHAPAGAGLVSCTDTKDAERYAAFLRQHNIPAAAIHSRMSQDRQDQVIADAYAGRVRAICHVDLLTEGVDIPWLRWLAMRRDRKSPVAIVQEVGRILRILKARCPTLADWGAKTEAVVLLPHATTVLDAIGRDAALDSGDRLAAAIGLRQAAQREANPGLGSDRPLPPAVAVGDVRLWMRELLGACKAHGVRVDEEWEEGGWRSMAPSGKQLAKLREKTGDARRSPLRYLPEAQRDAVKMLLKRPEAATAGIVGDLLTLSFELQRLAQDHRKRTGDWWRGIPDTGMPAPPDVGIASLLADEEREKWFKSHNRRRRRAR